MKNIFYMLALAFIIVSCGNKSKKEYALSVEKTLDAYLHKEDVLTLENLSNILLSEHQNLYQLIDLRTPPEYIKSHLKGAINIPAKNILDMEYHNILNKGKKINVLYCRDTHQAINIYMILKQLGFKNIKVALGGYYYINKNIVEQESIHSADYNDEIPKYDFLKIKVGVNQAAKDSIIAQKVK